MSCVSQPFPYCDKIPDKVNKEEKIYFALWLEMFQSMGTWPHCYRPVVRQSIIEDGCVVEHSCLPHVAGKQREPERKGLGTTYILQRHALSDWLPLSRSHLNVYHFPIAPLNYEPISAIDEVKALLIQSLLQSPVCEHSIGE